MTTTATAPETKTLEVPGATLTYDIRPGDGSSTEPPLFLIGSPMGAGGFVTLGSHFPERTVVTYDPRGVERSTATDKDAPITPHTQAEDVHAIIEALGGGPFDLFASSGGAVVTLDLVANHPGDLRTAVAHEPPLATVVPDREQALAATKAISDTYNSKGYGHGMAKFMQVVMHQGPFTPEVLAAPAMDPAMMGMPTEDDGNRSDLMLGHSMRWLVTYEPDFEQIKRAPTRLVMAVGGDSHGELAQRGGMAVAERLGQEAIMFPGDHGGFLGGEYGQTGKPDEFAAKLREVLAAG